MKPHYITGVLCSALLLAAGCAGTPRPTDQLVNTEAALRAAKEVGVDNVPRAKLHQTLAEEQLTKARKLMEDDENEAARSALARARADAELALALVREQEAQQAADAAEAAPAAARTTTPNPPMHVQSDRPE